MLDHLFFAIIAAAAGYLAGRWHAKRIAAAEYAARVKDDLCVKPAGGGGGGPLEPL